MESRHLYNEMLAQVKEHYALTGELLFKYSLTARFKGRGGEYVPASTVQTLADRLDKALRRFLSRKEVGKPAGFPRFKGANRWHSIHLRQYGKSRDVNLSEGGLKVPGKLGKSIKVKQHRPLEGTPKTAYLIAGCGSMGFRNPRPRYALVSTLRFQPVSPPPSAACQLFVFC